MLIDAVDWKGVEDPGDAGVINDAAPKKAK